MLQNLDMYWKEHLATMDHLRHSIHLSGYAQKNPKQEYKRESFKLFSAMLDNLKFDVIKIISTVQVEAPDDVAAVEAQRRQQAQANAQRMQFQHVDTLAPQEPEQDVAEPTQAVKTFRREGKKVGRNEPCPCGSGKKYKQCCGKL
jgi:preprotein translocase subunit SecA